MCEKKLEIVTKLVWCVLLSILSSLEPTTSQAVEPPFNLALVNVTHNTAEYRWEVGNTACGNRSNITGFARSLDDQSPLQTTNGIQTTDTVTGLQPNTQHRVTVRVMCEGGGGVAVSDFSFPLNFTTREFECPVDCQNGGTLNGGNCTCSCADGYSGASCEVCSLSCLNSGSLNSTSCSCDCVPPYTGPTCEACVLGCQNGGTLNGDTCSCDCVGGFSERNCSG
jgi:hypothetical protein